ncbi:hypothetical protein CRG98_026997 [Punica granatum]|uniref:RNase H type-1 domain-containing protein n=1 Tax=Punica granatum TaxID=22663 RepID=A0A2I0J8U3_PUNGR|nr:hypothetical protein CRG98_026997 [Punica granatum]
MLSLAESDLSIGEGIGDTPRLCWIPEQEDNNIRSEDRKQFGVAVGTSDLPPLQDYPSLTIHPDPQQDLPSGTTLDKQQLEAPSSEARVVADRIIAQGAFQALSNRSKSSRSETSRAVACETLIFGMIGGQATLPSETGFMDRCHKSQTVLAAPVTEKPHCISSETAALPILSGEISEFRVHIRVSSPPRCKIGSMPTAPPNCCPLWESNGGNLSTYALWTLWKHLNSLLFSKMPFHDNLIQYRLQLVAEFQSSRKSSVLRSYRTMNVGWVAPRMGFLKLNTDGSIVSNPGLAGGGGPY